jgi:hypothetical protein
LEVQQDVRARSLLVSEILAAQDRAQVVDCPIRVINKSGLEGNVTLLATGCSCYGVSFNGRKLNLGETVAVPPRGEVSLKIDPNPGDSQSDREYTARVSVPLRGQPHEVNVRCRLSIYQDLRITPNAVTFEAGRGESIRDSHKLLVEHVYRGSPDQAWELNAPDLPAYARLSRLQPRGPVEHLEDDLCRQTWEAALDVELPAGAEVPELPVPFRITAKNPAGDAVSAGAGQLIVHVRRAVIYPARIHFGKLSVGEPRQRRILVSSTDDVPFTLRVDPRQTPSFLEIQTDGESASQHWVELTATLPVPGAFAEWITLLTDRSEEPEVRIDVEGLAAPAAN